MLARIWEVAKATLAVAALIAAALVSADKLDRQRAAPVASAGTLLPGTVLAEPSATGAITPRAGR